jgi:outer membrane protein assembly factor BamB
MRGFLAGVMACLVCGFLWIPAANSQSRSERAAEWTTSQADPQRTGWQQDETKISTTSVKNLQLLWATKTGNQPMNLAGLVEPLIVPGVQTASGTKTLVFVAGSSDNVYAIDADTGEMVWQRHLKWLSDQPQEAEPPGGFICEDALTAAPVVTPANAPGGRRLYVLAVDGYLHALNLATGADEARPVKMYANPYAKANGLNYYNGSIYTISGQGCGSPGGRNPNSVYAVNISTGKASVMTPGQGGMFGYWGPSIAPDGMIYASTGDGAYNAAALVLSTSVLEVNPSTLAITNYYSPSDHIWLTQRDQDMPFSTPIFPYHGQELLVASGKAGIYYLLNAKTMGGANHETPLYVTPTISDTNVNFQTEGSWGGGSTWLDKSGTRWVLAPIGGATNPEVKFPITQGPTPDGTVIAMKVEQVGGKTELVPGWKSVDMATAETPAIANGVVFALAGGEFTGQANDTGGGLFSAVDRVERSVPAILYALDGETGKVLWSSGNQVKSFVHEADVAIANGRVVFGTNDGTVYCYGLK